MRKSDCIVTYLNKSRVLPAGAIKASECLIAIMVGYRDTNSAETIRHERSHRLTDIIDQTLQPD